MRFVDLLRTTVLLSAVSATALATLTVILLSHDFDAELLYVSLGWWATAAVIGVWLGRHQKTTGPIARLLAMARTQRSLPDVRPATTLINRLWPLLVSTIAALIAGFFVPQVPSIAAGFAIVWALAWRHQERAVAAIEERDGVRFYVEPTSPLRPIQLVRTPGFGGSFLQFDGRQQ